MNRVNNSKIHTKRDYRNPLETYRICSKVIMIVNFCKAKNYRSINVRNPIVNVA
jgi:hypothetical protein